jgi:hypothetical protein
LKQDGHETDLAEKWLDSLEDTLATFEHHRELILARLKERRRDDAAVRGSRFYGTLRRSDRRMFLSTYDKGKGRGGVRFGCSGCSGCSRYQIVRTNLCS